ncbi:MAG: hypothetical protein NTW87_35380, partial [Planctomycetota bacterium]|nr:hypothetical protein [Planctomycetota bacterium]
LKTDYGLLNFPVTRILHINRGRRLPAEDVKEITAALKDLDDDNFARRTAAQQKLEGIGAPAMPLLKEARDRASAEAKNRIDALLKKIAAGASRTQLEDIVKAEKFEAQGVLQIESLSVKSRLGLLTVKVEEVEMVRWLARGTVRTFDLDATTGLQDWQDTGLDAIGGDKLAITCSGTATLFGNNGFGPNGNASWGNRGKQFNVGAVIGRLGLNGKPFAIGNGKQMVAEASDRLYVRLFCPDDMNRQDGNHSGQFSVRVATGAWADELNVTTGP